MLSQGERAGMDEQGLSGCVSEYTSTTNLQCSILFNFSLEMELFAQLLI